MSRCKREQILHNSDLSGFALEDVYWRAFRFFESNVLRRILDNKLKTASGGVAWIYESRFMPDAGMPAAREAKTMFNKEPRRGHRCPSERRTYWSSMTRATGSNSAVTESNSEIIYSSWTLWAQYSEWVRRRKWKPSERRDMCSWIANRDKK